MSTTKTPLLPAHWYHIYNRGINAETLFREDKNYPYFLGLVTKHTLKVAEIYAYCLLSNHFHFLVRIVDQPENAPHLGFSHLFNNYSQSINKRYERTGSLFERPFHRKLIETEGYRAAVLTYIHLNPRHHQICPDFQVYPHSSYQAILSDRPSSLKRKEVLEWFGGRAEFVEHHQRDLDFSEIEDYVIEEPKGNSDRVSNPVRVKTYIVSLTKGGTNHDLP